MNRTAALLCLIVTAGCPTGESTDMSDNTDGSTDPVTYARIQDEIFDLSCTASSCHSAVGKRGDLVLEPDVSFDNLIDVVPDNEAAAIDGFVLVEAGNPDNSFLIAKCEMPLDEDYEDIMPFGTDGLDSERQQMLIDWVLAGAADD